MLQIIFENLFFLLILIAIGMFFIFRIKVYKSKSAPKQDKEEIELLKRRVEEFERNK
ncbi:hypothetical protein A33I_09415 [Alkalihalophilus marmarensis DSM 21297]|uniref:DUF4083 domain-containing protein n=2 Tax=Alkalihalophilus TaxID=2893060 RepID=U6SQC9_9BACI|nr:hypothetical protein A33I_09415 [Alkalihalophilus marmarensis DSM 21297]